MATSLTVTPAYPVVDREMIVGFSAASGNYVKGYFTDAPVGSRTKNELIKTGASRLQAFTVDAGKTWAFTADVAGVYTFTLEEYTKGATTWGGGYDGAAAGFQSETLLSTTTNVTLSVGQKVTQRIGFGADTATLTLFIVGANVRTSLDSTHGFSSPLISDAKTGKALTAALNATIVAAVAALADQTVAAIVGSPSSVLDDFISKFNTHRSQATVHAANDTDNVISTAFTAPSSPAGLQASASEVVRRVRQHMRNDDGGSTTTLGGVGTKGYHAPGGTNHADWLNVLLVTGGGEIIDTFTAIADLWRAYEAHRVNLGVHSAADNTNVLSLLPALLNIHRLFLAELQKYGPTAPVSVNSGVTALLHGAGFEESS